MKFFIKYEPTDAQKNIIREFQILHIEWDGTDTLPQPVIACLANTEQNLYFYPRDPIQVFDSIDSEGRTAPIANITGPKNKPVGLKFGKDYLMIKVAFLPTGLYRLLKIPMQKTVNQGLNAIDFLSEEMEKVNTALVQTTSYDEMIHIVSRFFDKKLEQGVLSEEPIDQVAVDMLNPLSTRTIPEWASLACLSLRQFERSFAIRVGLSPKMYLRVVRFEYAMKIKKSNPEKSWTDIALECGYDDSSHLLREFRQFAAFAPGNLIKKQTSGFGDFPTG